MSPDNGAALKGIGTVYWITQEELMQLPTWNYTVFVDQSLAADYNEFIVGNSELVPLNDVTRDMLQTSTVYSHFDKDLERVATGDEWASPWTHSSKERTMLAITAETPISAKPSHKAKAQRYWARGCNLLIADRVDTTKSRIIAGYSEQPTLSGAFVGYRLDSTAAEKAVAVYLNSTPGLLTMLQGRTRKLTYPRFRKEVMGRWPVPAKEEQIKSLAHAYDALSLSALDSIPALATDETRRAIDKAVSNAVPSLATHIDGWRTKIAKEPTVHGQRPNADNESLFEME